MGSEPRVPGWLAAGWEQRGVALTVAYPASTKARGGRGRGAEGGRRAAQSGEPLIATQRGEQHRGGTPDLQRAAPSCGRSCAVHRFRVMKRPCLRMWLVA